jgi:hypothetical protein
MKIEFINNHFRFNKFYYIKYHGDIEKIKLWRIWGNLDANGEFCERYYGFYFLSDEIDKVDGRPIYVITATDFIREKIEENMPEIEEYVKSPMRILNEF